MIYQNARAEERDGIGIWEAATNPRLRRGVGGEPVSPETAGARRAGRGDGERCHGALQRRHPSHPRRSLPPITGLAHPETAEDNERPSSSSPGQDNARRSSSIFLR